MQGMDQSSTIRVNPFKQFLHPAKRAVEYLCQRVYSRTCELRYRIICYWFSLLISPPLGSICFLIPLLFLLMDSAIALYIYHDSGIKVVSAFLRILGVAHVNPCQSLSKSCHRNDPGDDESTSCYMQCKNSLSPIQVHPMKLIRYLTNSAVQLPCQNLYGHTHTPMPLSV